MTELYDEEEDELDRLQREWDQEAPRQQAAPQACHLAVHDGVADAPAQPARRVRIPVEAASAAPVVEQESFEDQLAALTGGERTIQSPESGPVGGGRTAEAADELEEVRLFPKDFGGERRKGQHRPGLKRAPRFLLTEKDEQVIFFLSVARYCTVSTLSYLLGKEPRTVERRLAKLTERGYLAKRHGAAAGALYYATELGIEEIDSPTSVEAASFSLRAVKHTLAGANVLALLLGGSAHATWGKELALANEEVAGNFLTEKELRRAVNRQQTVLDPTVHPWRWNAPGLRARKMKLQSQWATGEVVDGVKGEADAPWTFLLLPAPLPGRPGFHVPDLVLSYPRDVDSRQPQAIAVEVELHAVNEEKLENAVCAYREDFASPYRTYGKVVWLCRDEKVASAVVAAAKRLMPREYAACFRVCLLDPRALAGISFVGRQANLSVEQKAARDDNLSPNRFTRGLYKHERGALAEARATQSDANGGE